jgi:hypothetical protein
MKRAQLLKPIGGVGRRFGEETDPRERGTIIGMRMDRRALVMCIVICYLTIEMSIICE